MEALAGASGLEFQLNGIDLRDGFDAEVVGRRAEGDSQNVLAKLISDQATPDHAPFLGGEIIRRHAPTRRSDLALPQFPEKVFKNLMVEHNGVWYQAKMVARASPWAIRVHYLQYSKSGDEDIDLISPRLRADFAECTSLPASSGVRAIEANQKNYPLLLTRCETAIARESMPTQASESALSLITQQWTLGLSPVDQTMCSIYSIEGCRERAYSYCHYGLTLQPHDKALQQVCTVVFGGRALAAAFLSQPLMQPLVQELEAAVCRQFIDLNSPVNYLNEVRQVEAEPIASHILRQGEEFLGGSSHQEHRDDADHPDAHVTTVTKLTHDRDGEPPSRMCVSGAACHTFGPESGETAIFVAKLEHHGAPIATPFHHHKLTILYAPLRSTLVVSDSRLDDSQPPSHFACAVGKSRPLVGYERERGLANDPSIFSFFHLSFVFHLSFFPLFSGSRAAELVGPWVDTARRRLPRRCMARRGAASGGWPVVRDTVARRAVRAAAREWGLASCARHGSEASGTCGCA